MKKAISLALVFVFLLSTLALPSFAASEDMGKISIPGLKKDGPIFLLNKGDSATVIALNSGGQEYKVPKGGSTEWLCVGEFGKVKMKVSPSGTRCEIKGTLHGYAYVGMLVLDSKGNPVGGCGGFVNVQKDGLCKNIDNSMDSHYIGFLVFDTLIQTPTDILDFFTGSLNLGTRLQYAIFGKHTK